VRIRLTTAYRHGLSWDAGDGRGHQPLPVEICVADNGPGVPEHLSDALFDPFVTNKRDGQGLGLALVDKLVRDMGGVVQYDRHNGWTRFRLHLPIAPITSGEEE
jgi:two-component system nitrogen regulation sensor histidine kinase GlnL